MFTVKAECEPGAERGGVFDSLIVTQRPAAPIPEAAQQRQCAQRFGYAKVAFETGAQDGIPDRAEQRCERRAGHPANDPCHRNRISEQQAHISPLQRAEALPRHMHDRSPECVDAREMRVPAHVRGFVIFDLVARITDVIKKIDALDMRPNRKIKTSDRYDGQAGINGDDRPGIDLCSALVIR